MKKFLLVFAIALVLVTSNVVWDACAEQMDTVDVIKSESVEMFEEAKDVGNDMLEAGNEMFEEAKDASNDMFEEGSEMFEEAKDANSDMLEEGKDTGNDMIEAASDLYDDIKAKIQEALE